MSRNLRVLSARIADDVFPDSSFFEKDGTDIRILHTETFKRVECRSDIRNA
jgi:hypothetical protein